MELRLTVDLQQTARWEKRMAQVDGTQVDRRHADRVGRSARRRSMEPRLTVDLRQTARREKITAKTAKV
jgi:hypothetical protein